jgi:hypothetical protein
VPEIPDNVASQITMIRAELAMANWDNPMPCLDVLLGIEEERPQEETEGRYGYPATRTGARAPDRSTKSSARSSVLFSMIV